MTTDDQPIHTGPTLPARGPWSAGPREVLEHGLGLLASDSDRDRRLAMIAIDNAVELMLSVYFTLPKRANGLSMSRKDQEETRDSWPRLLEASETHIAEAFEGISLADIEFYHRLRNQLYHQGNGLTVVRRNVEVYAALASQLMERLFGESDENLHELRDQSNNAFYLGIILDLWKTLNRAISERVGSAVRRLPDPKLNKVYEEARFLRNQLVSGSKEATKEDADRMAEISRLLFEWLQTLDDAPRTPAATDEGVIDLLAQLEQSVNAAKEARRSSRQLEDQDS